MEYMWMYKGFPLHAMKEWLHSTLEFPSVIVYLDFGLI